MATVADDLPSDLKKKFLQTPAEASIILADDGSEIGAFHRGHRILTPLRKIPPMVQNAFIAAEDGNFWKHPGFDLKGIARAAYTNYKRGRTSQGASTITQQVTKLILRREKFYKEKRDYSRKLDELVMSVRLERQLTKPEILEVYLNLVFLGRNAYGVAAAADAYFSKTLDRLTAAEAAFLACLVQGPSILSRNVESARTRQKYVLNRMRKDGYLNSQEYSTALDESLVFVSGKSKAKSVAPQFVEEVRRWAVKRYGNQRVLEGGLRFHSTLSIPKQQAAEHAVKIGIETVTKRLGFAGPLANIEESKRKAFSENLRTVYKSHRLLAKESTVPLAGIPYQAMLSIEKKSKKTWRTNWFLTLGSEKFLLPKADRKWLEKWQWNTKQKLVSGDIIGVILERDAPTLFQPPSLDGALVSMENNSGRVVAMVGGYTQSALNLATQARRQVGSSIKPFIYLTALENGYTPTTKVVDAPIVMRFGNQVWSPKNYDNSYRGRVPMRYALSKSLNTVSVRLLQKFGLNSFIGTLRRAGISQPVPRDLSVALGSVELTPMELATGYLTLASGGQKVPPRLVDYVTDREGNVIEDFRRKESSVTIQPSHVFMLTDMMQAVVQSGTARRAKVLGIPIAGKTGTTNDYRDGWFSGFTSQLVTTVWVGRRGSNTSIGDGATGGNTALPIWIDYMSFAHDKSKENDFIPPSDVWLLKSNGKLTPFAHGTVSKSLLPWTRTTSARMWRMP